MPFILIKKTTGGETQFSYPLPVDGLAVSEGMILKNAAAGRVDLAGNTLPEFVAVGTTAAATPSVNRPASLRVQTTDEFQIKTTFTVPSTAIGSRYVVAADSLNLTNSTAGGVFLIAATDGVANASTVRGFFK